MGELELIFGLLALMTVLIAIARRTTIPYPIFLVLAGLAISLIPGLPHVELEPELVFLLFLPPILTSAGYFTPIRDFRANLRSILLLAIGHVLFIAALVAITVRALLPELSWAVAFALGAIVAPPDAVAATSIAQRLNLPRRLITILEGESLLNDASALVAYRVAVAAALTSVFSIGGALLDFAVASVGGVLLGLVFGWLMDRLLRLLDDPPVETILTFLASFLAYLAGERLHVSGVLAAVVLGIYVGRRSGRSMSPQTRVQGTATWNVVVLLLNGLVFVLIGLQLPGVLGELEGADLWQLLGYGAAISAVVIVGRIIWFFPGAYLPRVLSARIRNNEPPIPWQNVVIGSWAGMRGIVSLAAALALPLDFPARNLLIFLTFCVILVTLVGQGLTLAPLIRWLGVQDDGGGHREEAKARLVAARAGLARLEKLADEDWVHDAHVADMREHYEQRNQRFTARYTGNGNETNEALAAAEERLLREVIAAEQEALLDLRDKGVINDEVLRTVQRELDLERLRIG
jgi:CPA1 family monovalent cation:H+ antiporter